MRRASSRNRGFSLVELMVVVVVIGLLAMMAIPRYNMTAHRSKEKEADMFLSQLYRLQQAYRAENNAWATTEAELADVGFKAPNLTRYTWGGSVAIPQCLPSTGPWSSRMIDTTGAITDC